MRPTSSVALGTRKQSHQGQKPHNEPQTPSLPTHPLLDDIPALVARSLSVQVCVISLAEQAGRGFRKVYGVDPQAAPPEEPFFSHAVRGERLLVVPDTLADPRFRESSQAAGNPGFRFFAAAPLITDTLPGVGALCIADKRPRELSEQECKLMEDFARLAISLHETMQQSRVLANTRAELKRLTDFNTALAKVARLISTADSPKDLLDSVCGMTVRHAKAKLAYIARPAADDRFEFIAACGETAYLNNLNVSTNPDIPEGRGYAARTWHSGLAHYAADIARESPLRPWRNRARTFGLKSTAILPIFRHAQIWAIFTVSFGQDVAFNEELRKLLDELALDISRGLGRLDLIAQEARVSTLHRTLLDNTLAGIALLENRHILSANRRMVEMLGYDNEDQLLGQSTRMLYESESEFQRLGDLYPEIDRTGSAVALNVYMRKADGSVVVCDVSAGEVSSEGARTTVWTYIDVSERQRLNRQLEYQAYHDALTKLPNRRALEEYFPKAKAHADRAGTLVALGVIDLDDFKSVNDQYGHDVGDQLLEALAKRLKDEIRESDLLIRYGGDEFILLIDRLEPDDLDEQLDAIVQRIHEAIAMPFALGAGQQLSIGLSMGLSIYPHNGQDFKDLLRAADSALAQPKNTKTTRARWWSVYAPSLKKHPNGSAAARI